MKRALVSRLLFAVGLAWSVSAGCDAKLPDPQSPGAQLYARRCGACHRLYGPGLLTSEMWRHMVKRKQVDIARSGLPPLSPQEKSLLLAYLQRHSLHGPSSQTPAGDGS